MKIVLEKGAYKPYKAHAEDAGFDLMSRERRIVPAHGSARQQRIRLKREVKI